MKQSFEDFPVYQRVLRVCGDINTMCGKTRGYSFRYLKDQILRSSSSILLNIAEGSTRWAKRDKMQFYRFAQASACESMAALDLFAAFQLDKEDKIRQLKDELSQISFNLLAMINDINKRKS